MWSRPEIVVMITLGREKLMQHMLLGVHEVTAQFIVVVLDELSCRWPVSRARGRPKLWGCRTPHYRETVAAPPASIKRMCLFQPEDLPVLLIFSTTNLSLPDSTDSLFISHIF